MDPKQQSFELVHRDPVVDSRLLMDRHGVAYGIFKEPGLPDFVALDPKHPISRLQLELQKHFPNGFPWVTSYTDDFNRMIVSVEQDNATTEYYVFDRQAKRLTLLFDTRPWLDDELLGTVRPIELAARDGLPMHGYLSLPRGVEPKNLPLIMVPHGGPHGPRDSWGFPWFEGPITMAGYAMLQVNFRGSGGYGPEFEAAGFRQWSGQMQDDLTDAVRWAIDQGIADPERICIFGWSYGGYAAVRSIEREPDLYRCSVAGAGVYDQDLQYRKTDFTRRTRWGKKYIDKVVGPSLEDRRRDSPVSHVKQIRTPLFLIHGEQDERVPIEHLYALERAMEDAGKPKPERLVLAREGHTPRSEENLETMWRKILAFFREHIGPGVKAGDAALSAR